VILPSSTSAKDLDWAQAGIDVDLSKGQVAGVERDRGQLHVNVLC
jgi:hypothetical protein